MGAGIGLRAAVLAVALVAAAAPAAVAQAPGQVPGHGLGARVDSIFAELDRPAGPGAAVAVLHRGEIVLERGYGLAQLEHDVAVAPGTVFHVASVSKQFAAFAVTLLAQDGQLALDDDIRVHLPELHDFGHHITVRHLIHHTSGIRDQWELLMIAGWRLDDVITRDQIMALMRRQRELNFEPGAEYLYSNMGYTLLAEIVERVSGRTFGEFLDEHVFSPLGMHNTHVHDDHERVVPNRAYSYRPVRGENSDISGWRNAVLSYANQGATSIFTTAGDLARWLRNFETAQVGGAAAIAQMYERGVLNSGDTIDYAFAIGRGDHHGHIGWGHGGADAGFRSYTAHFPAEQLGVVVLSNAANVNPGALGLAVADVYLGRTAIAEDVALTQVTRSQTPEPVWQPSPDQLSAFVGDYYSPELGVVYTVEPRSGELFLTHHRHSDTRLTPVSEDGFRAGSRLIRFERNAAGEVTGLRISGSRVRNLAFNRLAPGVLPRP